METANEKKSPGWDEMMSAKEKLGVDDEIFYALLYERMAADERPFTPQSFIAYLHRYMQLIFDGDLAREKKHLHVLMMVRLEKEITKRGLPLRQTANDLSRQKYGVDDVRWLRCWQLSALVYDLKKKGRS